MFVSRGRSVVKCRLRISRRHVRFMEGRAEAIGVSKSPAPNIAIFKNMVMGSLAFGMLLLPGSLHEVSCRS